MFRNALLALGLAGCGLGCAAGLPNSSEEAVMPPPLQWSDVASLALPAAGRRIVYGDGDLQFGELRLPAASDATVPVVLLIHGGCWLSDFDYRHATNLAAALVDEGYAVWTPEYRRVGDPGGGWPGTFTDVAAAADALRGLAQDYPLDLRRVVAVGHSAGGQLALWLAAREALPRDSEIRGEGPLPLAGVVSLAGITDMAAYSVGEPGSCNSAVVPLMGGTPDAVPRRYAETSPLSLLPRSAPQWLVQGARDSIVPPASAATYVKAAMAAGIPAQLVVVPQSGHFELVVPGSVAWSAVREAIAAAFRNSAAG